MRDGKSAGTGPATRGTGLARRVIGLALAALLGTAGAAAAQQPQGQQPYPNRPIRVVVPFAAGGGIDTVSRPLAQRLTAILGQPVLVDNRPGAAGNIALEHVVGTAPDGYTLIHANSGVLVTNPLLYKNLRAKPDRDLTAIAQVTTDPLFYIVPASMPVANLREFVEHARARPGQVSFASGGAGGVTHLVGELFALRAGLQLIHVTYRGSAPALSDLVAGRVQLMFDTLGLIRSHQEAGGVRLLAVAMPERMALMPDVPTAAEAGVPGAEVNSWQALMAPARTDPAIVARLTDAVRQALASPELTALYAERGFTPKFSPPDTVRAYMAEETKSWGEVIRQANIQLE